MKVPVPVNDWHTAKMSIVWFHALCTLLQICSPKLTSFGRKSGGAPRATCVSGSYCPGKLRDQVICTLSLLTRMFSFSPPMTYMWGTPMQDRQDSICRGQLAAMLLLQVAEGSESTLLNRQLKADNSIALRAVDPATI